MSNRPSLSPSSSPEGYDITTKEGFTTLYDLYSSKVFGFLMHNLQDSEEAKELLQDVFADVWHQRHSIKIQRSVESYLITMCKYKLVDYFKNDRNVVSLETSSPTETSSSTTPEDWAIFTQVKARMLTAFKKMPARTKEIFLLSRKEGLTNKEIAHNLNVTEKTVEYHITKTLKQLKTFFFIFF
ncbi:MAG: RNA polymerase sigma-70 factor [Bacteroidota bacterium]